MNVRLAKIQISLGIPPISSEFSDAQADLSLRWAHSHFVGFVMSRLVSNEPLNPSLNTMPMNNRYGKLSLEHVIFRFFDLRYLPVVKSFDFHSSDG